jgi:hypothetical protein
MAPEIYNNIAGAIPDQYSLIATLLFFTLIIVIYSVFVYYFYKFIAKKNIIELNLDQYNRTEHPTATKLLAVFFYIVEYIILLPVLTLIWFSVFSVFLLLLSETSQAATILMLSAALIASIRVVSYVSQNLSRDLAKVVPFTLLALFITNPNFFVVSRFFERISQIPDLLSHVPYYLILIIVLEILMRIFDTVKKLFVSEEVVNK